MNNEPNFWKGLLVVLAIILFLGLMEGLLA